MPKPALRSALAGLVLLAVSACTASYAPPPATAPASPAAVRPAEGRPQTRGDYNRAVARIEPVAEAYCREENPGAPPRYCDFRYVFDADPASPPNAMQTRSDSGRPVVVMTASLLGLMRDPDEIAFVLGHESAHHIAAHLPRQQQSQVLGALILGGIVAASGQAAGTPASQQAIRDAMDLGAVVGGRAYSQDYELEADWLGAFITVRAGYDPERGALIFARPALSGSGGPVILSSHPASPRRLALITRASEEIRRQKAAGLTPRPAQAGR
jgi:Zn-dependent protease with chaperone function